MIRRLLIANRGEIALRIIRACRELGIESVAVYSEADATLPHALAADSAFLIGPPLPAQSYLNVDALLRVAKSAQADAVHPGYGFLSERAHFARACEAAGLIFVGPPASSLERMGSKTGARRLMQAAGVPVVPGATPTDQSDEAIRAAVHEIGLPALLKPAAGGGGIGMKSLRTAAAIDAAIAQARREAQAAFGDGALYVERLVERPRHVEIQVFADRHGNCVHLFERECSIQRRHQKVIEESPCAVLTAAVRERMGGAAVAAARAVNYVNAGTVEFLLEGEGDNAQFYFLEMNTRLQVEHPVTEAVVGVDLVHAQLRVAAGEPLPWRQAELAQRGHAIECRVYAEDPQQGFLPQAGVLERYLEPHGPGIRVDSGYTEGSAISVYYDPLIAKLIVSAERRDAATARAITALRQFEVDGIRTNISFLLALLTHPRFQSADLDTHFIDNEGDTLREQADAVAASTSSTLSTRGTLGSFSTFSSFSTSGTSDTSRTLGTLGTRDPFLTLRHWRLGESTSAPRMTVQTKPHASARRRSVATDMSAPMPATVVKLFVSPGASLKKGDTVLTLEAMKMELPIRSPRDGVVRAVHCKPGELVQPGVNLVELEP